MKKFIHYYAADGTLNMPYSERYLFRLWVKESISLAFPEYDVEVKKEHNTNLFISSEEDRIKKKSIQRFVNNLASSWSKLNEDRLITEENLTKDFKMV